MIWLVAGVVLAVALLAVLNFWARADVGTARRMLFWVALGVAGLLAGALLVRGQTFVALLPIGYTLFSLFSGRQTGGPSPDRGPGPRAAQNRMSRAEALEILGLSDGASDEEVRAAYRRLISQAHPDKGGSQWMASKINAAKSVLLDE